MVVDEGMVYGGGRGMVYGGGMVVWWWMGVWCMVGVGAGVWCMVGVGVGCMVVVWWWMGVWCIMGVVVMAGDGGVVGVW